MQSSLNTFDTNGLIDYENLSIITRPRPPRRRQTGTSLIPFRPYVKSLTSVRQPFSFANGYDKWATMGTDEIFFTQSNARCIGSLLDDCDISDVIRWDIEGESTRLPMMCKLWMIVDGAIVERGKPHLVQDAAVQVFTSGQNLRALIAAQQRYNSTLAPTTSDRRRRQSWHDVNEYHSVPYYQYTSTAQKDFQEGVQCNMDNEQSISMQETLSDVEEESIEEYKVQVLKKEQVQETIHHVPEPQNRVHLSITTQTESRSTSIDSQLVRMYNLNLETNEILLSSIVNPYLRVLSSDYPTDTIPIYRNGSQYKHQSTSTGDDYPLWWLQLTTDRILSDVITNQTEEKEKYLPPPSPRQDQSVQTDVEKSRPTSSSRSSHIQKSSSSVTSNHYQLIDEIDDGNNSKRILPFPDHNITDYQIENLNTRITSSKQSETDYATSFLSLHKQSSSTLDHHSYHTACHLCLNDAVRARTKSSESTSTSLLASLLERYEITLRQRHRAIAIVNDELLDIDDVLKRYRDKLHGSSLVRSSTAMELYRDISFLSTQSKEERPTSTVTNLVKGKYRSMPGITSHDMIEGYIPTPKIHITKSLITSPRQRQPRYIPPARIITTRPDYCNLCLTDHNTSSAWVRYNERRIDELQQRIDLMLQIDDSEEALFSPRIIPTTATVSQRIDDILMRRPRYRSPLVYHHDRLLSPRRYQYRLPYRLNHSLPSSPRVLSRNVTRSTTPVSKSVRISTQSVPPCTRLRQSTLSPRPIISILRRSAATPTPRSSRLVESPHVWRSKVDGELYVLGQFSIPRYYRLYNDVSFRQMYNFSRVLDTYLDSTRPSTTDYSSMLKNFAFEQSPITSAA